MNIYTKLARESIASYLNNGKIIESLNNLPDDLIKNRTGVFVTLRTKHEQIPREKRTNTKENLRGCIGTIYPTKSNIAEEIISNTISAAFHDDRFPPLTKNELNNIVISVEILSEPEPIQGITSLNPKKYGVIVKSTKDNRIGLLLPNIDGIDSNEYQVALAKQKAAINPSEPVFLYRFETEKYQE
jgi:AmmeMemoRadiSam system protein A